MEKILTGDLRVECIHNTLCMLINENLRGPGLPSLKLKADANIPNGKAPIPKDIWKPASPNPNPGKP